MERIKHKCSYLLSRFAAPTAGVMLFAVQPSTAQVPCGALVSPGLVVQENQVAIGQELSVAMSFGISPSTVQISQFTVRLDCQANTGCLGDTVANCVDAGDVIRFVAFESLTGPGTAGTTVTVDESTVNQVRFIFTPPLELPAFTLATLQYRISFHGLGPPPFSKIISHTGQYSGVCAPGTPQQTSSNACGQLNFTVVAPDIHIEKEACPGPQLVCEGENNTVTYTYRVSTGPGNAPISNVCIVDDNGTPADPSDDFNSVQRTPPSRNNPNPPSCGTNRLIVYQSGDTDNDGILDPGEIWIYTATVNNITGARRNIATVTGTFVNALGSVAVDDQDSATVNAIRITRTPIDCGERLCATVVDPDGNPACVGFTCEWRNPNGQLITQVSPCCIELGPDDVAGDYCVTINCPGGNPCAPGPNANQATCCVEFTPPVVDADILCTELPATNQIQLCAVLTAGQGPPTFLWSTGETTPCILVSNQPPCDEYCVEVTTADDCVVTRCISLQLTGGGGGGGSGPFFFTDAITGDNQFRSSNGKHYWFVDGVAAGHAVNADNYHGDCYERPTVQTYKTRVATHLVPPYSGDVNQGQTYYAAGESNPSYFEYLDIIRADLRFVGGEVHAGIDLFGVHKVGDNGVRTADFGESSHYNIRIANNIDGRSGLLLAAENPKDLNATFKAKESMAYLDVDRRVGGPGGIFVTAEKNNRNGYELKIISDGKFDGTNIVALRARRITTADGRPRVEFIFDLAAFNARYPNYAINPNEPICLTFEATRGLKGGSNYLWNDKYTCPEAGTPYSDNCGQPQNIYELDTLCACIDGEQLCGCPAQRSVACLGDLDGDGTVGSNDLKLLLRGWGPCHGCSQDVVRDDEVNLADLVHMLHTWGDCR